MLIGAPTASIGGAIPIVCSNMRLFVDYQKHVTACERPCKVDPDTLIFDTHESHLSIPAINVTKE
jgi:hypothetical protein